MGARKASAACTTHARRPPSAVGRVNAGVVRNPHADAQRVAVRSAGLGDQFQRVIPGDGHRAGPGSEGYRQVPADLVFPQAENGQPRQHGTGLHAQEAHPPRH